METCRPALTLPLYQRGERHFNKPELSLINAAAFQVSSYIGKGQLHINTRPVWCDAYAFFPAIPVSVLLFYCGEATEERYLSD